MLFFNNPLTMKMATIRIIYKFCGKYHLSFIRKKLHLLLKLCVENVNWSFTNKQHWLKFPTQIVLFQHLITNCITWINTKHISQYMDYITKCALQNAPLGIKLDSEIQLYVNVNQNVPYQTLYADCLDHINNQMQIQNFSIPRKIHIQKTSFYSTENKHPKMFSDKLLSFFAMSI